MTIAASSSTKHDVNAVESESDSQSRLTEDQVFHVLQNQRRRWVLKYLEGRDGQVRMRDIAEQVAAWEHDTTVQALTSKERQRVYIPLYQNHLPKLDEEGIIDYNQSRGIVERTRLADQLNPYLDPFEDDDADGEEAETFPWELSYLGAAGVGGALVAGETMGMPVVSMAPDALVGVLVLLLFTVTTIAHVASERVLDQ
ncbi:hypothetical protein HUG10_19290 (plasmid) [Halorarum halophilum]|uniref:DUF7344 domain-containing protein n=1 Tax=Halorarum halophilum TaxID=2743090 RepID=A0A7D5GKF7_9EURY|nr:hypothetical protein [Halobaculum halophilum]QLG29751.1 hypothetical protein HUG10_19290 [Halobaculum halophilum]